MVTNHFRTRPAIMNNDVIVFFVIVDKIKIILFDFIHSADSSTRNECCTMNILTCEIGIIQSLLHCKHTHKRSSCCNGFRLNIKHLNHLFIGKLDFSDRKFPMLGVQVPYISNTGFSGKQRRQHLLLVESYC